MWRFWFKTLQPSEPKLIDEHNIDILLADWRSLYTAIKKRIAFVDVNQEKKVSYGAYGGLENLAIDVCAALSNPVFKLVGQKAPWEQSEWNLYVNPLKLSQPMGATLAFFGR